MIIYSNHYNFSPNVPVNEYKGTRLTIFDAKYLDNVVDKNTNHIDKQSAIHGGELYNAGVIEAINKLIMAQRKLEDIHISDMVRKFKSTTEPPVNLNELAKMVTLVRDNDKNSLTSHVNLNLTKSLNTSVEELCPLIPAGLVGKLKVIEQILTFDQLENINSDLMPGGRYMPKNCIARQKIAVIIPYRDREKHLKILLNNIHPLLKRQQADYSIYVIEQDHKALFNRAKLFNIGYVEAQKQYNYDCYIFHDVDLIPEDDRNLYRCGEQPRHMSVAVNIMNYKLPYIDLFGGVSALSSKHLETVNGFSNVYWGWGGEDDDMSNRLRHYGLRISRYPPSIARYTMMNHKKATPNSERYRKLYKGKYRYKTDGLNSLRYKLIDIVYKKLFTWILVDVMPPDNYTIKY